MGTSSKALGHKPPFGRPESYIEVFGRGFGFVITRRIINGRTQLLIEGKNYQICAGLPLVRQSC